MVAMDLSTRLLLVPVFARENIATLFLPDMALFFDLQNNMRVLGREKKYSDGLYFIDDRSSHKPSMPTESG